MDTHFAAFLGISILLIVTPGPDMALVMRNSLLGGRGSGIFTGFGVCTGQMVWVVASCAGVTALLVASEPVFKAVKLIGAAYLIFLGIQSLRSAFRRNPRAVPEDSEAGEVTITPSASLHQGLISNIGNPKMAVFFTSLLPQFVPGGGTSFVALLLLGICFCLMTLVWLIGYSVAVARAGDFLRRPRIRRAIEGLTGGILTVLGLKIATESR